LVILEDQLGIDRDATNLALKRYYPNRDDGRPGGKTWSLLSLAEIEETLGLMRGRVKQQAQQEAQQEAQPDQDEEGEI